MRERVLKPMDGSDIYDCFDKRHRKNQGNKGSSRKCFEHQIMHADGFGGKESGGRYRYLGLDLMDEYKDMIEGDD